MSTFPLVESDFLFLILEASLYAPTGKGDQQQRFHLDVGRCVADEELDFLVIQRIAGTIKCNRIPGSPRSSFIVTRVCLASQTSGPFSPSFTW